MEIREYMDGDIDSIAELREQILIQDAGDWSFTVHENGEILACFGCYEVWNGVGHIWMAIGEKARGKGLSLTRIVKHMLKETVAIGYHRIQAYVDATNDENCRWIKLLGLSFESTMIKGAPDGGDLNVYTMVK